MAMCLINANEAVVSYGDGESGMKIVNFQVGIDHIHNMDFHSTSNVTQ